MRQRNTDRQGFGVLPAHIHRDPNVTPLEKCILLDLSQYAGANGDAWPRVALLAEHQGVSRPTIYRALASLEKRGLVERHARRRSDGSRSSNLYMLRFNAWGKREVFSPVRRGGLGGDTGGSAGETGPVSPVVHREDDHEVYHLLREREALDFGDAWRDRWQGALLDCEVTRSRLDCWFQPLRFLGVKHVTNTTKEVWLSIQDKMHVAYVGSEECGPDRMSIGSAFANDGEHVYLRLFNL